MTRRSVDEIDSSWSIGGDEASDVGLQQRFGSTEGKQKRQERTEVQGEVVVGFRLYAVRDVSHRAHTFHASFRCFFDWVDPELAARLRQLHGHGNEAEWSKAIPEFSSTPGAIGLPFRLDVHLGACRRRTPMGRRI